MGGTNQILRLAQAVLRQFEVVFEELLEYRLKY
jgi:hypothetical protein